MRVLYMSHNSGRWFLGSHCWYALRNEKTRLLGAALLLVAARTAEGGIEPVFLQGHEQRLRLHKVGMHLAAVREGPYALLVCLLVVLDDEIPVMLAGITVSELYHLAELPLGVYVHLREGYFPRIKGLLGPNVP